MNSNSLFLRMSRWLATGAGLMFTLLVAGCGGGGGAGAQSGAPVSEAAALVLSVSGPSLDADGRRVVTLVATVKDLSNRTLSNQPVDFSTVDPGATLKVANSRSDANGLATATLSITDLSTRIITVSARSGALTQSVNVAVTGGQLTLDNPNPPTYLVVLTSGPTLDTDGRKVVTVTATVKDSANRTMANQLVDFGTSDTGATLLVANSLTNASGVAVATLSITETSTRTITVSARSGSLLQTVNVSVAGGQLTLNSATDPAFLLVTSSGPTVGADGRNVVTISAVVKDSGNRTMVGQQVDFATSDSGATLQVLNARTDASGMAIATLSISDTTSRTIAISARTGALQQSINVSVIGGQLTLNSPSNLASLLIAASGPTTAADGRNIVTITATARDTANRTLINQPVEFSTSDAGATLQVINARTDLNGNATATLSISDTASRTISVTARSAALQQSVNVSVAGGQLTLNRSTDPASLLLTASGPSLTSDGRSVVNISAVVKDTANRTLTGQLVDFSTVDAGATLLVVNSRTDASGAANATLSISDTATRTIVVNARNGGLAQSVSIAVVGGQMALNRPTDPASMLVITSAPTIGSDGRSTVTVSAVVKDSANRTLANQLVDFATPDVGATLQVVNARTDLSGLASATLSIADKSNRTIVISARSGALQQSVSVAVVGTQLTLNGPSNLVAGAANDYTVSLRDSSAGVIAGKSVTVASAVGNTLSASTVVTDGAGQARFQVTGVAAGADTLTVSALGTTATVPILVSATQLSFTAPLAGVEVPVSTAQTVTVRYLLNGLVQPGQTIDFLTTRGSLSASSATTNASGIATVSISSPTAGPATITARAGNVTSAQRIEFVSRTPSKISLQSSPANVGVNLTSSSTNSSQLIAVVRDVSDNPVKGALVSFSAIADPSNGSIDPPTATTDSSGVASVAFFPGSNSTGNNQIRIQASVTSASISAQTTLTASRQELVVRIGTGNQIEPLDSTKYAMPWTAAVTDASGNPVVGASIQASLVGSRFQKGSYYWNGVVWVPRGETSTLPVFVCASEDLNGNLRLDAGEDLNGNGALDPANVAAASLTSEGGRTDATGFANLRVVYAREFANWTEVRLRVTITTLAGTEGSSERTFVLPVLAADISSETTSPPGSTSPFGRIGDCASPN
jgi:hypothetical protein